VYAVQPVRRHDVLCRQSSRHKIYKLLILIVFYL
jgi:hypothetical protein